MIKLNTEIANGEMMSDCEVHGSGREVISELAAIIHKALYSITDSPEEFAAFVLCLTDVLNGCDYEVVKEAFENGIQRQSD